MDKETWRCSVCNCAWEETVKQYSENTKYGRPLCNKHYVQMTQRGGIFDRSKSRRHEMPWICDICGSDKRVKHMTRDNEYNGYVLCAKHSAQVYRHNKIFDRTRYDDSEILLFDDRAEIVLYDIKNNVVGKAKIDIEDVESVSKHKWTLNTILGYAYCGTLDNMRLHQYLVDYDIVDHINRDRLDNRKKNLRRATIAENGQNKSILPSNTSGYTGVGWIKPDSCWCAKLTCNGELFYKSGFKNKYDAIVQRLIWEKQYFKEFAPQKHLFEEYGIVGDK